jgi:hypothetical protein
VTKTIETLVSDIHDLLGGKSPLEVLKKDGDLAKRFGERMQWLVHNRVLFPEERTPRLSPSNIGRPCVRQTWLEINRPETTEKLSPVTKLKFLYGDVIEELLLFLAEAAGHRVEGRQDRVEIEGIHGNRDVIIDGVLCDVKSASTYSFAKFRDGNLVNDDPFGYVGQIQTYLAASLDDPLITDKDRCAFFVMDKTLGHICLDIHPRVEFDVKEIVRNKKAIMEDKQIPPRGFDPLPDGKSGNLKLPMNCSYCSVKHGCHDGIRTFLYSYGPVHLTTVVKEPNVPEIKNNKEEATSS